MDWTQLIIQLGISALVIFTGYQIAMKLIDKWSKGDETRTAYIQEGFKADILAHNEIVRTMQTTNHEIVQTMQSLANQFFRVEGKMDGILDLTPVRDLVQMPPSVIVEGAEEEGDTPVDHPQRKPKPRTPAKGVQQIPARNTPPHGVPAVGSGYGPITRPKTSGGR